MGKASRNEREQLILLSEGKKVFFASDLHLGSPSYAESREREKRFVNWIEEHRSEMGALFLLGDIFDYWFEYRFVIPKGYVRLLGIFAELCDEGIPVLFFCGNHDSWMKGYFEKEIGMRVFKETANVSINGKTFLVGHGDGLGPNEYGYKLLKCLFEARLSRAFFAWLHPWVGYILATGFSRGSRKANQIKSNRRELEDSKNKNIRTFIEKTLEGRFFDYFIFAHRHCPVIKDFKVKDGKTSKYLNTGDWLSHYSYGVFDGENLSLGNAK
ncbi:MAG: UDP-2,3-diacylglucosamine diphosphatase [Bacteroidales bacterium]|jgi:UDP-2,3-diacylglucosamine hydrolase|nr:UDP-2,3-diacylglucosamine diphosphatase [Bacteroidales bacterium]